MHAKLSPNPKNRARKLSLSVPQQRNVGEVIFSDLRVETWYPSFYPTEIIGKSVDRLFICKWCFKYTTKLIPFIEHTTQCCSLRDHEPVGSLIYRKDNLSIYEVDGYEHHLFAQNLSLFAKLFLETKSVFYDVTTFIYYTLVYHDVPTGGPRIVGFFSKEKLSWDSNNLACLCVFPPWQKRGFGQVLMAASYELSKWDKRLGGPEKPLSEMGRKAYISYWSATVARYVMQLNKGQETTIEEISQATYILPEDVIWAMKEMEILESRSVQDAKAIISKSSVAKWMAKNKVTLADPIDSAAFIKRPTPSEQDEEEDETEQDS